MIVRLEILGEPASMKNSRKLIPNPRQAGRMIPVLSDKARRYLKDFKKQVPIRQPLLVEPLLAHIKIWYASQRPDLDEAIILDALQRRVYENDRQIREKHVYHAIDRANPRTVVILQPYPGELLSTGASM